MIDDNINFEAKMAELEEILKSYPHLRLSARMVIQRGRLLTNNGNVKDAIAIYDQGAEMAILHHGTSSSNLKARVGVHFVACRVRKHGG